MIGTGIGLGLSGYRVKSLSNFKPSDITGLQLWLDSSDSTTLLQSSGGSPATADGDPVGYWGDKSGNARHATQSSGTNKPALKLSILNSKNVVRLDGSNDYLTLSSDLTTFTPRSLFAVWKKRTTGVKFCLLALSPDAGGQQYTNLDYSDGNVYNKSENRTWVFSGNKTSFVTTAQIIMSPGNYSDGAFYVNGSAVSTTDSGAGSGAGSKFNIVGSRISASDYGDGDLAELIYYGSALSNSDRDLVLLYLTGKWGTY
jgi:hypothetical protein